MESKLQSFYNRFKGKAVTNGKCTLTIDRFFPESHNGPEIIAGQQVEDPPITEYDLDYWKPTLLMCKSVAEVLEFYKGEKVRYRSWEADEYVRITRQHDHDKVAGIDQAGINTWIFLNSFVTGQIELYKKPAVTLDSLGPKGILGVLEDTSDGNKLQIQFATQYGVTYAVGVSRSQDGTPRIKAAHMTWQELNNALADGRFKLHAN